MDDEVQGGWRIDDATRQALRLDRVRKALDKSDWPGAVLEVEELLDETPDHPEALFLLAEALHPAEIHEGAAGRGPGPGPVRSNAVGCAHAVLQEIGFACET